MSHPTIDRLSNELEKVSIRAKTILDVAERDQRDLSEDELGELEDLKQTKGSLERQISIAADNWTVTEEVADRLRTVGRSVDRDFKYRSAGELLWDVLHQTDPDAKRRYSEVHKRAAEHMVIAVERVWQHLDRL